VPCTRESVLATQPRLIQCTYGPTLAVSPDDSPVRIGVMGDTPDLAREEFAKSLLRWADTLFDDDAARRDP